jgi:1-aminocyclopropane-1-carboxylate deaminase/D-cysteine desulfhydrase-like pyridoxal-dependent ACC family enzyme
MPRFDLTGGRSPLIAAPRFSAALGGTAEIWLKREDLLPLAFGGNKLRNLEFLIGDALARGADALVTSGRRWSNHCRLTAAAGARAGLEVHLALTGPPSPTPGPNERLDALLGAHVHVAATGAREDREELVATIVGDLVVAGRRPYHIGVGGSGFADGPPVGAVGQVVAGLELLRQTAGLGWDPAAIVVPTATGGTHAGLLTAVELARSDARVVGVAVGGPADEARATVAALLDGLERLIHVPAAPDERIEVDGEHLGPGYGRPDAAATEATELLARTEGVFVDPIYTAKALAGLIAAVRDGRLRGRVVFWHAGGLPALFDPPG